MLTSGVDEVVDALAAGMVVAIPTDTVYGLAAVATDAAATDRIFVLKQRPAALVLPVLVASLEQAAELGEITPLAAGLAEQHWPGALTIVVERRGGLGLALGGDDATVGVRVPDLAVARDLCLRAGPLATTSANRHGEPPLTAADAVDATFGGEVLVLDGGVCDHPPSTVVDATGATPRILRQGAVTIPPP